MKYIVFQLILGVSSQLAIYYLFLDFRQRFFAIFAIDLVAIFAIMAKMTRKSMAKIVAKTGKNVRHFRHHGENRGKK